jgi:hypothetical protein
MLLLNGQRFSPEYRQNYEGEQRNDMPRSSENPEKESGTMTYMRELQIL